MMENNQKSRDEESIGLARERTSMASQRTFLSWVRTGLATVGGGLALAKLISFENLANQKIAQHVGEILVLLGMAIFILSYLDYWKSHQKMKKVHPVAGSLWSISLITLVLIVMSIMLFIIVFKE